MKILEFLPGMLCIALGGYLAVLESDVFGWFLGIGFILALSSLGTNDEDG